MQLVVENIIGELYLELATERAKFREANSALNYTAQMLESCKQELTSVKQELDKYTSDVPYTGDEKMEVLDEEFTGVWEEDVELI